MGIYDRDYQRNREDYDGPGVRLAWPQSALFSIVLVTAAVYVLQLVVPPVTDWLKLRDDWPRQPWRIYGLLTSGFLHSPGDLKHIFFNMLGLVLLGQDVCRRLGNREFTAFYLAAVVFSGLMWTIGALTIAQPASCLGASGAVAAVVVLCVLLFPRKEFLMLPIPIPIPAPLFGLIFVGGDIYGAVARHDSQVAFSAHLGGALFAFLYWKLRWRLADWLPTQAALRKWTTQPKLRVHQPDADDEPEGHDAAVDRILQKIQTHGQASLTSHERKLLEQASQRYQQRRRNP